MNSSSDLERRRGVPDPTRRMSGRPLRGSVSVARFDEQFVDPSKDRRGMATPELAFTAGYEVGLEQGMSIGRASTVAEHAASDRRMALVGEAIEKVNKQFARVEQIKQFRLIEQRLTAEDEELTPTMKLKRSLVNSKYAALIEGMYSGKAA